MALSTNLVSYYKLDNVNDSVGANTLTNRGTTAFNTGKIGNAADTGASNSTKNLYCSPPLTYAQIGSGFTFSFWVNVTTSTSSQIVLRHIVNNGSLERGFYVQQTAGGKWLFSLFDGSGHDVTSSTSVATSTWVYITCVYTGSVQRLYINGVEEGTALTYSMSGYSRNTLSCFSLGAYQDTTGGSASNWYSGLIDEVGVWSRYLTQGEISQLYNGGSGNGYPLNDYVIGFDSNTAATTNVLTSLTYSHTCTGSDRILFVTATGNQGPTATMSATYNGVSMTAIGPSIDSAGTGVPTYVWYLVAPSTGANNIVVTSSVIGISTSAVSYIGVDQSSPIDVSNTTAYNSSTTSYSKSVTTTVDNCWLLATVRGASGAGMTAGANTTVRNQLENTLFGGGLILDSGAAVATGSNTLTSTCTSQFLGGQLIIAFKPAGGGGGATYRRLALTGVGN